MCNHKFAEVEKTVDIGNNQGAYVRINQCLLCAEETEPEGEKFTWENVDDVKMTPEEAKKAWQLKAIKDVEINDSTPEVYENHPYGL